MSRTVKADDLIKVFKDIETKYYNAYRDSVTDFSRIILLGVSEEYANVIKIIDDLAEEGDKKTMAEITELVNDFKKEVREKFGVK